MKCSDKDVVASVRVCKTCLGKLLVCPQPCLARRGHDLVMNRFNQLLAGTGGEGSRERFWSRLASQAAWVRYPSASPAGRALWERGWGQVKSTVLFFLFTPILTRLSSRSFQYCLRHVGLEECSDMRWKVWKASNCRSRPGMSNSAPGGPLSCRAPIYLPGSF